MKIVFCEKEARSSGGIGVFTKRFSLYLQNKGHEIYSIHFSNTQPKKKNVFTIPYYFAESRTFVWLPSHKTLSLLRSYLSELRPDIVYVNLAMSSLDGFIPSVCHELGIPVAAVWHNNPNQEKGILHLMEKLMFSVYLPLCRNVDLLQVFSHSLKAFYKQRGVGEKSLFVLPNGVDTSFYTPGPSKFAKRHGIKRGVLFLGRLSVVKNPELVIKTFLALNPPETTKMILSGQGELASSLQKKYHDPRIMFTGQITNEKEKLDIMRACQIFVLPSYFEGISLALLEAMSCGLACIVTDAGAHTEVVDNSGIILNRSEAKNELPLALRLLLDHPQFAKHLGKSARTRVRSHYHQDDIFRLLTQAFQDTITRYHTG